MSAARASLALAILVLGTYPVAAELPPRYTVWADFAAVTSQPTIAELLGVVDRIERADNGSYIVRAGKCSVVVTVFRAGSRGAGGVPIPGPSHIARVEVGAKRCTQ
jgi:hypothetical protein